MFVILSTIVALTQATSLKPPTKSILPSIVLNQFPDYDLVIHFDSSTHYHLDFLSQKNPDHQTVHLFNYNYIEIKKQRPDGYKYINIVILQDSFKFQKYSLRPYNFFHVDFVIFITTRIHEEQVWRMAGLKRAAGVFIYESETHNMFHCCYYCGNTTAILKSTNIYNLRKLLNDYSNFNGHIFRIAYTNFPPFFWKRANEVKPRGAEGKLLHEFSRVHNFRYELIEYKSVQEKGAWQAMVEAVEANAIDWAVGGLSVSIKRGIFTDFTRYIKTQGFAICYVVYQSTWVAFESILLVFKWLVWVAIACTIVVICFIAKVANNVLGLPQHYSKFARVALMSIGEQAATYHQMKLIKLSTVRTIFLIWWLSSLSLTSMYKSQLASCLIKPKYNQPNRIDDLVEKNFRFQLNKEDWSVLKENLESSSDPVYSKLLTMVDDSLDFCTAVLALKGRKLAVIDEETALQYDVFKRCRSMDPLYRSNLRLVTENIFPSAYHAWSMPMGTPFRLKFSKTIGRMDDYGLIAHWYKSASFYHIPRSNSRTELNNASPLTLTQFLPPLMILGIGWSVAFVVLLIELYIK